MAPMPTYCTPEMADFLTNNGPWGLMVSEGRLDLRPVVSGEWNRIDDQLQARARSSSRTVPSTRYRRMGLPRTDPGPVRRQPGGGGGTTTRLRDR